MAFRTLGLDTRNAPLRRERDNLSPNPFVISVRTNPNDSVELKFEKNTSVPARTLSTPENEEENWRVVCAEHVFLLFTTGRSILRVMSSISGRVDRVLRSFTRVQYARFSANNGGDKIQRDTVPSCHKFGVNVTDKLRR